MTAAGDLTDPGGAGEPELAIPVSELRALVARLTRLEDERAIIDTLHSYGQAADGGDCAGWADLFVEEGLFLCMDRDGRQILREQGRPALMRWLRDFRANETMITKHCVLAPVLKVDGKNASSTSYFTRISENPDPYSPPFLLLIGTYHDELTKGDDGRWRFTQRTAQTQAPLRRLGTD